MVEVVSNTTVTVPYFCAGARHGHMQLFNGRLSASTIWFEHIDFAHHNKHKPDPIQVQLKWLHSPSSGSLQFVYGPAQSLLVIVVHYDSYLKIQARAAFAMLCLIRVRLLS